MSGMKMTASITTAIANKNRHIFFAEFYRLILLFSIPWRPEHIVVVIISFIPIPKRPEHAVPSSRFWRLISFLVLRLPPLFDKQRESGNEKHDDENQRSRAKDGPNQQQKTQKHYYYSHDCKSIELKKTTPGRFPSAVPP